jgi:replicative DNA helicase
MTLLPEALAYAASGALIFPLNPDKTPATRNGMKDGTTNTAWITSNWRPDSIIGCRVPEKLVLLDIDPRHGGDKVWNALIEAYGPIEVARQHHSGRNDGGFHAWFQHPGGDLFIRKLTDWAVLNNVAYQLPTVNGREKWTCGIDILHHGHRYTILPPSPHPETGKPYAWDTEGAPGPMPAFLAALLEPPEPPPSLPTRTLSTTSDADSIADWYTATASWSDILTGWTLTHGDGETDGSKWRHPAASAPYSASIRHGCLFVYSANTVFEETSPSDVTGYTKFRAMAEMSCGGDLSLAATYARELRGPRDDAWTPAPDVSFNPGNTVDTQPITPNGYADATDTAEVEPWPEPIPIGSTTAPAPFPLDAFPSWIADQCAQAAVEMQLTPDLAAQLAMACLSVVTSGRVTVAVKGPWTEPGGCLFLVTSLPPSAGKSPTLRMMCGVLDAWEEGLIDASGSAISAREIERKFCENDIAAAIKSGEKAQALALGDDLLELYPEIAVPRLLADDVTPEKLVSMMGEQGGRIALVSAEGGGLFAMMIGRYSAGVANLEVYLSAWSGSETIKRDRISAPPVIVRRPHLTIGLAVQPDVLRRLAESPELAGRGLTSRFLYALPAPTVGFRDLERDSTYDKAIAATYDRRMLGLAHELDARVPVCTVNPVELELSPAALRSFRAWAQGREAMCAPGGQYQHMAEWLVKCNSSAVRLAGMLHLADLNDDSDPIGVETMERAQSVAEFWTSHAISAFDLMGVDEVSVGARILLEWIERNGADTVSVSEMQRSHRRRYPRAADIVEAVEMLVERGWLRPLYDSTLPLRMLVGKPRMASPAFTVSPSALLSGDDSAGPQSVPLCTTCTTNDHSECEIPPKVADDHSESTIVVTVVPVVYRENQSLTSSISTLTGDTPESRTTGTTNEIEATDTASAIEADPVDNFDPMDLV